MDKFKKILKILPQDYSDYGGEIIRWEDPQKSYPDCSCGCKWAAWLRMNQKII